MVLLGCSTSTPCFGHFPSQARPARRVLQTERWQVFSWLRAILLLLPTMLKYGDFSPAASGHLQVHTVYTEVVYVSLQVHDERCLQPLTARSVLQLVRKKTNKSPRNRYLRLSFALTGVNSFPLDVLLDSLFHLIMGDLRYGILGLSTGDQKAANSLEIGVFRKIHMAGHLEPLTQKHQHQVSQFADTNSIIQNP